MSYQLDQRLNMILPKIKDPNFLSGKGVGNDIAFYIFDYAPEFEPRVREHIKFIMAQLEKNKNGSKVMHINLFQLLIDHLQQRKLLDRSITMQQSKGDDVVMKALTGPLAADKLSKLIAETVTTSEAKILFLSGVGSAWPLVRTHRLLNNLHALIEGVPLVLFYPGEYDGQYLRLFNLIQEKNYYRAFRLVE